MYRVLRGALIGLYLYLDDSSMLGVILFPIYFISSLQIPLIVYLGRSFFYRHLGRSCFSPFCGVGLSHVYGIEKTFLILSILFYFVLNRLTSMQVAYSTSNFVKTQK